MVSVMVDKVDENSWSNSDKQSYVHIVTSIMFYRMAV